MQLSAVELIQKQEAQLLLSKPIVLLAFNYTEVIYQVQ